MPNLIEYAREGSTHTTHVNPHPGQWKALTSTARFPVICAGTQGGKTSLAPLLMDKEIKDKGPGDYGVVTATYDLFKLKLLPEFHSHFVERLGWEYHAADRYLSRKIGSQKWRMILRSADSPGGLESSTWLAALFDEPGQPQIPQISHEAIIRRLSLASKDQGGGRLFYLTTLYGAAGWFINDVVLRAMGGDPDFELINWPSWWNPAFPKAEYDRQEKILPDWKFQLFYNGILTKPAGLIYNDFNEAKHVVKPFKIPDGWKRFVGVDFGLVHTAILWLAEDPDTEVYYVYRESLGGGLTQAEWAVKCLEYKEPVLQWRGGSASEDVHRSAWAMAGVPLCEPTIQDVEGGIDHVIGLIKQDRLLVFETMTGLRSEIASYSRELDSAGEPTEKIADKATFHRLDSLRYVASALPRTARVKPLPEVEMHPRLRVISDWQESQKKVTDELDVYG